MASYRREPPNQNTCCRACCRWCQGKLLIIINLLDFIGGGGLIAFGFYIYDKKFGPDYVYIPLAAIGMFVICTVFFSTCGASCWNSCWACCLYPISALMGFLLALGEITAGSLLLAYRKRYSNWLDQNHQKYNISDNELEHLKHGILTVSIGFFALAVLEVLRICVSRGYKYGRRYDEEQQRMMDDYEDMERRERADSRNRERREKHARLRAHYSQKYDL